jgi:glycerol uptake facilitator-like aquaporin
MLGKKTVAILFAEFLGTFALTSVVFSMLGRQGSQFFIPAAAGITLALAVMVIGGTSGAHINPAVTLGMWSLRKIETTLAIAYIVVQFFGAYISWQLNAYFLGQTLSNTVTSTFEWRVLIAEAVGAFVFTFGIAAAVYLKKTGYELAAAIGASLFVGILIASYGSNAILNPAVALGIRSFNLAYVVGPIIGAVLGMNTYALLFAETEKKSFLNRVTSRAKSVGKKKK